MNKLLLSKDYELENLVIEEDTEIILSLSNCTKNVNILIENNVCVNFLEFSENSDGFINFILKENARLICNRAIKNPKDQIFVKLDGINSSVVLNNSIVNTLTSTSTLEIRHSSANTSSELSNHGINNSKGNMEILVNAYISNDANGCLTTQENKIINTNSGKSNILPNLIVDNDDVNASHSAFIGEFDKEYLFYMKSRGITENESKRLLKESFLVGNLEYIDEYIDEVKRILL